MKIRVEGNEIETSNFIVKLERSRIVKIKSVSKFYPNKAFGFERSQPQKEGRVYVEVE